MFENLRNQKVAHIFATNRFLKIINKLCEGIFFKPLRTQQEEPLSL